MSRSPEFVYGLWLEPQLELQLPRTFSQRTLYAQRLQRSVSMRAHACTTHNPHIRTGTTPPLVHASTDPQSHTHTSENTHTHTHAPTYPLYRQSYNANKHIHTHTKQTPHSCASQWYLGWIYAIGSYTSNCSCCKD